MTDLIALARRWKACKNFRWMGGEVEEHVTGYNTEEQIRQSEALSGFIDRMRWSIMDQHNRHKEM